MVKAYVLVLVAPGSERKLKEEFESMEEVKEVHVVYGPYDLILVLEVEDIMKLNDIILNKIRSKPEVENTTTLVVAE